MGCIIRITNSDLKLNFNDYIFIFIDFIVLYLCQYIIFYNIIIFNVKITRYLIEITFK